MAVTAYARPIPFRQRRLAARRQALRSYSGYSTTAEGIAAIQAQIISIKTTLTSGVEEAAYGDKRVGYRSMEELREILAALEEELDDLLGIGGKSPTDPYDDTVGQGTVTGELWELRATC